MNVPNLPTDNLYKFIALTGIVLFLVALIYPEYKDAQLKDAIALYNAEVNKNNTVYWSTVI